jgi:hypothetical protein
MLDWLKTHSDALNLLINLGMLGVWVVYLQLFLMSYLNQRRPSILITRGAGLGLNARCIVGNMSADPIYVMSIIAQLSTPTGDTAQSITDLSAAGETRDEPLSRLTKQGPLLSGHYMDVDSYRHILERLAEAGAPAPDGRSERQELEIIVVARHGSDALIIGARRRFRLVEKDGKLLLLAVHLGAVQVRSRRARRKLRDDWIDYLES